ncbi:TRAP transporter substrate-binding protein [Sporosarcina cascadiensis]|uniref:TRAP transporter substrate-binding protein n=1 Tax=Sporosarcina cascadiensis TaxID=2660747 RepID=UPI00129B0C77|nr:TRAP transporter substrate-binding protein [Sporosarcina cascadiensis]
MKRFLMFLSCMMVFGMLAGCAGDSGKENGSKTEKKVIKLGHIDPAQDTDPYHVLASNFKNYVEESSDGSIEVDIISDAQLGSEISMIEGMKIQTIDAAVITNFSFGSFNPKFMAFDLPYLFDTKEEAYNVLDDQDIMSELENELYDQYDVKILSWGEGGFRSVINSIRPIRSVSDLKGIKIRVPENPLYVDTFKALGANPTTMASNEVFTGLQQGTIDGLEQPITPMYTFKTYEVSKYISLTDHFYSPISLSVSRSIWESLDEEERTLVEDAAKKAAADERVSTQEVNEQLLKEMEESGAVVNNIDDKTPFRESVQSVYDKYQEQIGEDLMKKIESRLSK